MYMALLADFPGTSAGPLSPLERALALVSSCTPPFTLPSRWQLTQFSSRMGWTSLTKSTAPCEWVE